MLVNAKNLVVKGFTIFYSYGPDVFLDGFLSWCCLRQPHDVAKPSHSADSDGIAPRSHF